MSKPQYFCVKLTKRQTDYLATLMQNHMDVSDDNSVVQDSKRILKKLEAARIIHKATP